jgi:hypothetical protein
MIKEIRKSLHNSLKKKKNIKKHTLNKGLYNENHRALKKEIAEDSRTGNNLPCS